MQRIWGVGIKNAALACFPLCPFFVLIGFDFFGCDICVFQCPNRSLLLRVLMEVKEGTTARVPNRWAGKWSRAPGAQVVVRTPEQLKIIVISEVRMNRFTGKTFYHFLLFPTISLNLFLIFFIWFNTNPKLYKFT